MAIQGSGLYGPTKFSPCLQSVVEYVKSRLHEPIYHLYLILTDGAIHDMIETKDLVVEGSNLPLSIIIIGIGDADFKKMEELDGDQQILRNQTGVPAKRDIVQFVKFNDFR